MKSYKRQIDPDAPKRIGDDEWEHAYGMIWDSPLPRWQVELYAWRDRWDSGFEPVEHLKRCISIVQPSLVWHSWLEDRFRSISDDSVADKVGDTIIRNIPWVGCGAAGKTHDSGVVGFWFWLAHLGDSCVALTSTGKQKMRQRVWSTIQECWREVKPHMEKLGSSTPHMLNSTMELQATKGDSRHAIFAQAVETGEVAKAVERLKGVHCGYIMLVIDEAPGTPEAIFQTIPNMQKGCMELIVVCTGNGPDTHYDPFSRVCKPVNGWGSISKEATEWDTVPVPEFQLPKGRCLHFRGKNSPNVIAEKTLYPFLYTWENWQRILRSPDILRTAQGVQQDDGFWPPEGFKNTVLTEELIEQGNARGKVQFASATMPIGAVDPAFGGDKCMLRFGEGGELSDGRKAFQINEAIVVPILIDLIDERGIKVPADVQVANFCQQEAERRKVKPFRFGVEASGTGRGVAALLIQNWGEIVTVESGGAPPDCESSEEDSRPAKQAYDRQITFLYFQVKGFVRGGQVGGLTFDDCEQFCARLYTKPNKVYILEKKEDLKARLGRSPDNADSVCIIAEVMRRLGMATRGPRGKRMLGMWDSLISEQQKVYAEKALYQPEEAP